MKKILNEYFNILGYTLTGLLFGLSFFLICINFYHYKNVHDVYVKQEIDVEINNEIKNKLKNIKANISYYDVNNYNGIEDKYSLLKIKNKLDSCVNSIQNEEFSNIISKSQINIKDIYEMQQFYQKNISNECLVKQLYELSLDSNTTINVSSLSVLRPFLNDNINNLKDSNEYVKKVIKGNSSYYFTTETSKMSVYDILRDSYYSIQADYVQSLDFIEDISIWFKNVSGGSI